MPYYNDAKMNGLSIDRHQESARLNCSPKHHAGGAFLFGQPARDALYSHVEPRPFSGTGFSVETTRSRGRRMMPNTPNHGSVFRPSQKRLVIHMPLIKAPA